MSENKSLGQVDLLHGPIMRSIILFAIPIFTSMLFQQLYNAADTAIVGNFLGENSLAAIGSVSSVFELIIFSTAGLCGGMGIVIARAFGSNDEDKVKRAVAGTIMIAAVTILIATIAFFIGLPHLLKAINTPDEIYGDALAYIRIITLFLFVTISYNIFSEMLRAIGNSVMPLVFLIISSVLNVIIDYIFIAHLNMGVRGAAIATVIAQGFSASLCAVYMVKKVRILIPSPAHFKVESELIKDLWGQGYAMMMMSSIVSISSVILQSGINGLGTQIIAAHLASRKLFGIAALPFISMAGAISVFISQNKGAGQGDRIISAMKRSYVFFAVAAFCVTVFLWSLAPVMVRLISGSDNPVIIENGSRYLHVLGPFLFVLGIINSTRSGLQGIGVKIIPLISSTIELCGKVLFVTFLIPRFMYNAVIWCEPVIWVFMAAQLTYSWYTNRYIMSIKSN